MSSRPTAVVCRDGALLRDLLAAAANLGLQIHVCPDPLAALDAFDRGLRIGVLATEVEFGSRKPHGIALARMARLRWPDLPVLIVGPSDFADQADGVGAFVPDSTGPERLAEALARLARTVCEPVPH